jgi:hypothetical protein
VALFRALGTVLYHCRGDDHLTGGRRALLTIQA